MINIGQNIQEELQRQERSVAWFSRKLNCNRAAVYRLFAKNSVDTALLSQVSLVLNRNFFHELSAETDQLLVEQSDTQAVEKQI